MVILPGEELVVRTGRVCGNGVVWLVEQRAKRKHLVTGFSTAESVTSDQSGADNLDTARLPRSEPRSRPFNGRSSGAIMTARGPLAARQLSQLPQPVADKAQVSATQV